MRKRRPVVSVSPKQPDAGETGQDDEADEESEFEDSSVGKGKLCRRSQRAWEAGRKGGQS